MSSATNEAHFSIDLCHLPSPAGHSSGHPRPPSLLTQRWVSKESPTADTQILEPVGTFFASDLKVWLTFSRELEVTGQDKEVQQQYSYIRRKEQIYRQTWSP